MTTPARTDFWALERGNRRQTALLVAVFIALFATLGCGLDFVIGDLQVIQGRLVGFPGLTLAALIIGSIQSLVSYYGGASLVLLSVHARELTPDTPKHQMVLDVVREMALAAQMLIIGKLAKDEADARARLLAVLESGAAAERFARMVKALSELYEDVLGRSQ